MRIIIFCFAFTGFYASIVIRFRAPLNFRKIRDFAKYFSDQMLQAVVFRLENGVFVFNPFYFGHLAGSSAKLIGLRIEMANVIYCAVENSGERLKHVFGDGGRAQFDSLIGFVVEVGKFGYFGLGKSTQKADGSDFFLESWHGRSRALKI